MSYKKRSIAFECRDEEYEESDEVIRVQEDVEQTLSHYYM